VAPSGAQIMAGFAEVEKAWQEETLLEILSLLVLF
jgi:hypothetical protein